MVIAISPGRHFALSALKALDDKGKPFEFFGDLKVVEFQEPKPGFFLPKVIRGESSGADGPKLLFEVLVSDVTVNEPIDEKEFSIRFPEGIPVVDRTKGEPVYMIWGKGEPKIIFKSNASSAIGPWRRPERR